MLNTDYDDLSQDEEQDLDQEFELDIRISTAPTLPSSGKPVLSINSNCNDCNTNDCSYSCNGTCTCATCNCTGTCSCGNNTCYETCGGTLGRCFC